MKRFDRNISENIGPWNPAADPAENAQERTATLRENQQYPLRPDRNIALPKISTVEETTANKKMEAKVKMSRLSLELTAQSHTARPRETGMSGSVLHFYREGDKRTRYQSISVELSSPGLERKMSTIQIGEPVEGERRRQQPGHYLLNV
jgi:hypothetical protein